MTGSEANACIVMVHSWPVGSVLASHQCGPGSISR